jgi:AcrR family transcriptional regulator
MKATTRRKGAGAAGRRQRGTRQAILERAVALASEEGLEGLTIGRLASELEMSKSGLFGHFGSKEGLQLATVDAAAQRFVDEVVAPAAEKEPGAPRLRAVCDRYITHLERGVFPGGCFWAAVTAEFDDRPGPVRDAIRDRVAAWLGGLAREAEAAGVDDPRQLAFELWSLAQGANAASRLLGDRDAFRRARRAMEGLLP